MFCNELPNQDTEPCHIHGIFSFSHLKTFAITFSTCCPGCMFLNSSLAHVINTCASTCSIHTCQHVYYIHVLARVLYTHASTCTMYTCQHVCLLHVLGQRSQVFGTDFKVKVEVLFCIINIVMLSSLTTNVNPALLTPSPSPPSPNIILDKRSSLVLNLHFW